MDSIKIDYDNMDGFVFHKGYNQFLFPKPNSRLF